MTTPRGHFRDPLRYQLVIDGAVVLIDSVEGVEAQTKGVWKQLDRYGVPTRMMFSNKQDRPVASFKFFLRSLLKNRLQRHPMDYLHAEPGIQGLVDLVKWKLWRWDEDGNPTCYPLPTDVNALVALKFLLSNHPIIPHLAPARTQLLENLSMFSEDLMETLLTIPSEPSSYLGVHHSDIIPHIRKNTFENKILPVVCGLAINHIRTSLAMDYDGELSASPVDDLHDPAPLRMLATDPVKVDELPFGAVGVVLCLKFIRTGDTLEGQTLIHGLGALHLESVEGRFHANFELGKRRVSYREALGPHHYPPHFEKSLITKDVKAESAGNSVTVALDIRPLQEDEDGSSLRDGNLVLDKAGVPISSPESSSTANPELLIASGIATALSSSPHSFLPMSRLRIRIGERSTPSPLSLLTGASAIVMRNRLRKAGMGSPMEPYFVLVSVTEDTLGKVAKDPTEHGAELQDLGDGTGYPEEGNYISPDIISLSSSNLNSADSLSEGQLQELAKAQHAELCTLDECAFSLLGALTLIRTFSQNGDSVTLDGGSEYGKDCNDVKVTSARLQQEPSMSDKNSSVSRRSANPFQHQGTGL
ncbi:P-loop containing nucleoside triphosphate hydrolase protein [Lentinula raphanica]|nr:P-loop containing nucleoside triphosphate hydrolase protein [Lentinula raphanica]